MFYHFEFTTGGLGLQSSCRTISLMINGYSIYLRSISSLKAKGLNTCVNMVVVFFFCNKLENILKTYICIVWCIVCKLMRTFFF